MRRHTTQAWVNESSDLEQTPKRDGPRTNMKLRRWFEVILSTLWAGGLPAILAAEAPGLASTATHRTVLGVQGTQFTLNGRPTFLYGLSYYGALGVSQEFILQDLAELERYRFNWIRVWANWTAFGHNIS